MGEQLSFYALASTAFVLLPNAFMGIPIPSEKKKG